MPSAVVVTDFAPHRHWLHPANDLFLCLTPEIARDVRGAVNRPAEVCGPLVARRFGDIGASPSRDEAYPYVLVSTGAWGAGRRTERTAREVAAVGHRPLVLCGHDEQLRRRLSRLPGVSALGWVNDMAPLPADAHALFDNAAGQTSLQALAAGVPVIGHRPIPGHGRDSVRAMAEGGPTVYAHGAAALGRALDALPARGRDGRSGHAVAIRRLFDADPLPALEKLLHA